MEEYTQTEHVISNYYNLGSTTSNENSEIGVGSESSGHGNYDLRENPKSSWRVSDQKKKFVCTQCGKEFKSNRALFGHMRCHSAEERRMAKLQSKYPMENPTRKKRSKRRYNTSSTSSQSNDVNFASYDSDADDQELEEIAQGLLMLSYGGLNSVCDIFDHGSANLESMLLSNSVFVSEFNDGVQIVSDDKHDEMVGIWGKGVSDVNSSGVGCGDVWLVKKVSEPCGFSDGLARIDCEMDEFEVHGDGYLESVEFKKSRLHDGPGCGLFDAQTVQNTTPVNVESPTDSIDIDDTAHVDTVLCGMCLSNEPNDDAQNPVTMRDSSHKPQIYATTDDEYKKNDDFKCMICCKNFHSRQALGGHRLHCPIRRKSSSKHVASQEGHQENTDIFLIDKAVVEVDQRMGAGDKLKLSGRRTHECSICYKAFQSGHALGGHMRAHFASSIRKEELIMKEKSNRVSMEDDDLNNAMFLANGPNSGDIEWSHTM